VKAFIYRCRFVWFWGYIALLTYELLLKNPWVILGKEISQNPPLDTHSAPASAALHIGSFSVLGILASFAFLEKTEKTRTRYALWLVLYAGLTEAMQTTIPGRWASGEDVLFNIIGLVCGALIFQQICRLRKDSSTETLYPIPA